MRSYRYLDVITAGFVAVLLISNVAASKPVRFTVAGLPVNVDAALILFPVSYIFGDILVEVYGYARTRRVIWLGFAANLLMAATFSVAVALPAPADWTYPGEAAYNAVLGQTPRIVLASLAAFWLGEFANSYVMARMKVLTEGRALWARTIGSTAVGQAADTAVFETLAFAGLVEWRTLGLMIVGKYAAKVGYEVLATPLTYLVVNRLKRAEGVDRFDRDTDFNPFRVAAP